MLVGLLQKMEKKYDEGMQEVKKQVGYLDARLCEIRACETAAVALKEAKEAKHEANTPVPQLNTVR